MQIKSAPYSKKFKYWFWKFYNYVTTGGDEKKLKKLETNILFKGN